MNKKHIKQLTIGGFQVFAEPVTIPFGQLTLLYGPNSAGKSAILNAMLALADLCDCRTTLSSSPAVAEDDRINSILGRHWRRQGDMSASPVKTLQLGASVRVFGEEWARSGFASSHVLDMDPLEPESDDFKSCFQLLLPLTKQHIDVEVSFQYELLEQSARPPTDQIRTQERRIKIGLNGSPILQFCSSDSWAAINLNHEALRAWTVAKDLRWIAQDYGHSFVIQDGWIVMSLSRLVDGWLATNAGDSIEPLLADEHIELMRNAETEFISLFSALFLSSLRSMREILQVPRVQASRAVPRRSEATFLFAADATPLSSESIGLNVNGRQEYLEITRAAFLSEMKGKGIRTAPEKVRYAHFSRPSKYPIDLINRLLGEYLFRSSGYFVAAGIHELTPIESGEQENKTNIDRKFLVSLELRDSVGRKLNFNEVGSGIGYVFPVLLAVASSDVVFLQQPELHLHPALQSELADALIAALSDADFGGKDSIGCKQIIVETHSEHLLLRLLRRIRQAADPNRALDPHSIGREDVVVLYVDPKSDGASSVTHLRISRDGEFIDRWPRGFFEERWGELFDE